MCACSIRVAEFIGQRLVSVGVGVRSAYITVRASRHCSDDTVACLWLLSADAGRRLPRLSAGLLASSRLLRRHEDRRTLRWRVTQPSGLQLQYVKRACASISLHGWGDTQWPINPPTTVILSFTFILSPPRRNGVRSHSRCGTES